MLNLRALIEGHAYKTPHQSYHVIAEGWKPIPRAFRPLTFGY
jgi:hypothetical protein